MSSPAINPSLLTGHWPAHWATYPNALAAVEGTGAVFLFRKTITLSTVPNRFIVHVSADQRYRLWVNGEPICFGPARGDLMHWNFESIDLASHLKPGTNIITARVHFFAGENAPVAQISSGFPGFLMQGDTEQESEVNTPKGWRVTKDASYSFDMAPSSTLQSYTVVGPSEIFDAAKHPFGWLQTDFDDTAWQDAVYLKQAAPFGTDNAETHWWLVQRALPLMEETVTPFGTVRRSEGIDTAPASIPAHTKAVLLFDHSTETCAFPQITVSGGAGATLTLSYSEGLHEKVSSPWQHTKGNRNEIDNKVLRGYGDTWHLNGTDTVLDTLWWRTFRYAQLTVETGDEPLTIQNLAAIYTGYPWERKATFIAPELPEVDAMREVGWRTLRLCSHETYMDCPYYEQLQYAGDTRIQCLASLYETGDARLFRNALKQLDDSRAAFGLTMSRYPSRIPQVISPFSLWWVCMVQDYAQHVPDSEAFVRTLLPGVRSVLEWFLDRLDSATGLLGAIPHWDFVDWCSAPSWKGGNPPGAHEGGSSILTLQLVLALQAGAKLFTTDTTTAARFQQLAEEANASVLQSCYDKHDSRISDTPDKTTFSQHGGILAVLTGLFPDKAEQQAIMRRILTDISLTQATFYFRFYLTRALVAAGMGDEYLNTLQPWRDMLAIGLTTWAEKPEPSRSDCHAWSASPNYEFLATVLGVRPVGGWREVVIEPHLGFLTKVSGSVPVPGGGSIEVSLEKLEKQEEDSLQAQIISPCPGQLIWQGKSHTITAGEQTISL